MSITTGNPKILSTRSLRFDQENLVYMIIRRYQVVMRTSDFQLNATQICNTAGLNEGHRRKYLQILKTRCDITKIKVKGRDHFWVPFKDGVFLCQALKISGEMEPLLSQGSLDFSSEEINYLMNRLSVGYKALQWGDKSVTYIPSVQRVNATGFLRLGNIPRIKLARFFSQNLTIFKQVLVGNAQRRYIKFEDAGLFCQYFI